MGISARALSAASLLFLISLVPALSPLGAQAEGMLPESVQTGEETPWIYRGSDVPQDKDWLFGELDNGLRYAVRNNRVPPGQVSIRIRIDAGSLHERDHERGFAHLLEHLLFRESQYLGPGEAIPTWQRLGASFGSDTNAETSPTHTVYKLDLPGASPAAIEESFKLLSGMIRAPVLSQSNLDAEIPIVLAEKRERGGAGERVAQATRRTFFAGQRLADRSPIGTEVTLKDASPEALTAFHRRWYRPENTVIAVAGDADAIQFAQLIEQWFSDWQGQGEAAAPPDFGDPVAPEGADPANPIGELAVIHEPDMPRSLTYAIMRKWRQVEDTIVYNEGRLIDALGQRVINRRLEARARGGGSYLYAEVRQEDVSRSSDATFVGIGPLDGDWQGALRDVRAVIADALAVPPTQEEIDREYAEFESVFRSEYEQSPVKAGRELADEIVYAVDIREAVAAPDTVLSVFQNMKPRVTPESVHARTKALFEGDVIRAVYVTPDEGDRASKDALKMALSAPVDADPSARLAASSISFDELPEIGKAGTIVEQGPLGVPGVPAIEQVAFGNGVRAIIWSNDSEPGRVAVRVRFGAGYKVFSAQDAPYIALGKAALISSGLAGLGQEELDRLSSGRKMGFNFAIDGAVFEFSAQTRSQDVADQLYLFAAKLALPEWDANPVLRAKAAAQMGYDSYATSPSGVLTRDLEFLVNDRDARFATPDRAMLQSTSAEGFRKVWEPILAQGPVEVLVFGDFEREATLEAMRRTFGALAPRPPVDSAVAARARAFPAADEETAVLTHRGDANQAAAAIVWPTGGGVAALRESRQLEILTRLFGNRLLDAMREQAGASYAPQAISDWPIDEETGGKIMALAQLHPSDVPVFFAEADRIARDLASTGPSEDELRRATEPLRQRVNRALTGNSYWLYQLRGASFDPRRTALLPSIAADYSYTTPEIMNFLAKRYFGARPGYRIAVIPEGDTLASEPSAPAPDPSLDPSPGPPSDDPSPDPPSDPSPDPAAAREATGR